LAAHGATLDECQRALTVPLVLVDGLDDRSVGADPALCDPQALFDVFVSHERDKGLALRRRHD
jgi:hypothetical protein